jgi:MYXO-CTERM domain-containing protein
VDQGLCYSDAGGQGHNVMASQLPDGRYFILVSETRRPATIYTSNSLDGPWQLEGTITTDANGYPVDASPGGNLHSNTTLWVRPDGSILGTARDGVIMLSTSGILGPYLVQGTSVYANIPYTPGGTPEDPALWYSGGQYHMVYSYPLDRVAYHLTSPDGIHDWVNAGLAWDATQPFIRYTDGTVNTWNKLERPQVYLEDGHVKYFSFAAIDVDKDQDNGNDNHGSKIIVVPFDGERFDAETGIGGAGGMGGAGGDGGAGGTATGGAMATGGAETAGAAGSGGAPGSGGAVASGGIPGTGGLQAAGGSLATGGVLASGGSVASGGTSPITGGTTSIGATGGSVSTGGVTTATGGVVSLSGGTTSGGGSNVAGGTSAAGGGTAGPNADAGPTGTDASSKDGGCGCRVAGERSNSNPLAVFGVLGLLALRSFRRRPTAARRRP